MSVVRNSIAVAIFAGALAAGSTAVALSAPAPAAAPAAAPAPASAGHASAKRGSGLGSIAVTTTSSAIRAPFYSNSGEDVEGEIPFSMSTMQAGFSGSSTTSVFWPGGTGANGGSTIYLLGPQCVPPQVPVVLPLPVPLPSTPCIKTLPQGPEGVYNALNDPYVAKAQTGAGKPVDKTSMAGVTQKAVAKPYLESAASSVKGSTLPKVGDVFGQSAASTTITVTGPKTAKVVAKSTAHNISLASSVLKIGTVTSVAKAVSATVKGKGSAKTTVAGASVAGVPVTINGSGLHVKGKASKLPALTKTVNSALKQAGIAVFVAKSTKSVKKANVNVDAGSVIVLFKQADYLKDANDTGDLLVLGGASIEANTTKAYIPPPVVTPPTTASSAPAAATSAPATPTSSAAAPASNPPSASKPGAVAVPSGGGGGSVPNQGSVAPAPAQSPEVAPSSTTPIALSSSSFNLPSGFDLLWLIFGLVLAGGLAFGLKRLPDKLLQTPTTICSQEEGA